MLIRSTGNAKLDAFIEFEVRYNQTRWAEVWMAIAMTLSGMNFLSDAPTFALSHGYDFIAQYVTEKQAGGLGLGVGIARLFAIWVNGSKKRSPFFRVVGASLGALFWGGMLWGFWVQELPEGTVSGFVPVLAVLTFAEIHCSARAARDMVMYVRYKELVSAKTYRNYSFR